MSTIKVNNILPFSGTTITANELIATGSFSGSISNAVSASYAVTASHALNSGGGSNIGTDDLTIDSTGTRKLTMAGAAITDRFDLRNSDNELNIFSFAGDGTIAIGLSGSNSGDNSHRNVVIGASATNGGYISSTVIGYQAQSLGTGGTSVGYTARAAASTTSIGLGAGSAAATYSTNLGASAICDGNYSIAIGHAAAASALKSGMINFAAGASTNDVASSLAVNFTDEGNHIWRIAESAYQWNTGTGGFGYGTMTPHATAIVDMTSTTKGFKPPVMTTTQKNAISEPIEGLVVYDSTLGKLCVNTDSESATWETITSS